MMYSVESERTAMMKSKASPSVAHRSVANSLMSLFLGLVSVRIGLLLFSSSGQQGENDWLVKGLPQIVMQTGVLHDVPETIELLMVPFGKGISAEISKFGWADELMAEQERLDSRMKASRFTHNRSAKFNGATAWGRDLIKLQDGFKERMATRAKLLPLALRYTSSEDQIKTSSASLDTQQEDTISDPTSGNQVWSAKNFPGADQAWEAHSNTMRVLESRTLARQQMRLEKQTNTQKPEDLIQVLDAQDAANAQRLRDRNWAQGVRGELQAEDEHAKRLREFEIRKAARQQSRLEKREVAQATKDGFAEFFEARMQAQAQRRRDRTWARGFPGASDAYAEHEQRMQELEARKLVRQQIRLEKQTFAEATKDAFAKFFQARKAAQISMRKNQIWARDLLGEKQAYADHGQRMQELEARRQRRLAKKVRRQRRLQNQDFAQATKNEFAEFFRARRKAQIQSRKEQKLQDFKGSSQTAK